MSEYLPNLYDREETYSDCTVQILTNTITGEKSVGWWQNVAPRSQWLYISGLANDPETDSYKCSSCGKSANYPYKYCPNCGLKMAGAKKEAQE